MFYFVNTKLYFYVILPFCTLSFLSLQFIIIVVNIFSNFNFLVFGVLHFILLLYSEKELRKQSLSA